MSGKPVVKPGNILVSDVDGKPLAKVIDFGITNAVQNRITGRTLFTEHGQLIGTPEYMSPEQAAGGTDVDTRTDIYSLGVLMYELLTGSTSFDSRSLRSAAAHDPLTCSLELCRKGFDPVDWRTGMAQGRLGECLSNMGMKAEAEELLSAGVKSMQGDSKTPPDVLKSGMERLAAHYERNDEAARAAEVRRQVSEAAIPAK